jgi:hypothetical protein
VLLAAFACAALAGVGWLAFGKPFAAPAPDASVPGDQVPSGAAVVPISADGLSTPADASSPVPIRA